MVNFSSLGYDVGQGAAAPGVSALNSSAGSMGDYSDVSLQQQKAAALGGYVVPGQPRQGYGIGTTLVGDAVLGVPDALDTVASSIPFLSKGLGIQRGDLNNSLLSATDAMGLGGIRDFYNDNQDGIHVASGIEGLIGADIISGGLAGAAPVVGLLSKASWGRKALALDSEYNNAMKAVNISDEVIASKGILGSKAFTTAMGDAGLPHLAQAGLDSALAGKTRAQLLTSASWLGAKKGIAAAAKVEAVSALTLNQNEFLYSADTSSNIANAALGLVTGGVIGSTMAKYAIRKFVNSDSIRRLTGRALDPSGFESVINAAPTTTKAPNVFKTLAPGETQDQVNDRFAKAVDNTYLGKGGGTTTDEITAYMADARQDMPTDVDRATYAMKQQHMEGIAQDKLTQVTSQGIPGINGSRFAGDDPGYGNHARMILHNDPYSMLGTEYVGGGTPQNSTVAMAEDFFKNTKNALAATQDLMKSDDFAKLSPQQQAATVAQMQRLKFNMNLTDLHYVNGAPITRQEAQIYAGWTEPTIKSTPDEGLGGGTVWTHDALDGKQTRGVSYASNGEINLPRGKNINTASAQDMLTLYRLGAKEASRVLSDPDNTIMQLPAKPNWFHLDLAQHVLDQNPNARVVFPKGMTADSAQVESLAQKADALTNIRKASILSMSRGGEPTSAEAVSIHNQRFNLPSLTAWQQGVLQTSAHPIDNMLNGAITNGGGDAIRTIGDKEQLLNGLNQVKQIQGANIKTGTNQNSLSGNMFNFLTDDSKAKNPIQPLLVLKRQFQQESFMPENIENRMAIAKVQATKYLVGPSAAPATKELTAGIVASPDAQLASQVSGLNDPQIASSLVPGAGNATPQGFAGRAINAFTNAEFRARDNPVILGITRLRESVDRNMSRISGQIFQDNMGDLLSRIGSPRNTTDMYTLHEFHSFGQGWDFLPPKGGPSGVFADGTPGHTLLLDDTVANQKRYQAIHGSPMPDDAVLLNPNTGKPVMLTPLAHDVQTAFNAVTDAQRVEKNTLLESMGASTISSKPYYIPPPNPANKFVGYTYDAVNNRVPGGAIYANTQAQFDRMLQIAQADTTHPMNQEGNLFRSSKEEQTFATLQDRVQRDMLNPGTVWIQPGKQATGSSLSSQINLNAFNDSLDAVKTQFNQHGRDILAALYDPQIKALKIRSDLATPDVAQGQSRFGFSPSGKNIWDYALDAFQGSGPIASSKSILGAINEQVEKAINVGLTSAVGSGPAKAFASGKNQIFAAANKYLSAVPGIVTTPEGEKTFKALAEKLGPAMPFRDVSDLMEQQGFGAPPQSIKKIMNNVSQFESTWLLRMMEPVQAFMNLAGVVNAAPAVIRHTMQQDGESLGDYAQRVGHAADIFTTPQGKSYGVVNMAKVAMNAFKRTWSPAGDADMAYAAANGMLSQEGMAFRKQFNAMDIRSPTDRFLNGDPTSTRTGIAGKFDDRGLVGWLSWMTDRSEDFSRGWSHAIGLQTADMAGVTGDAARHNFAHDIANKIIANYNPGNRAPIFQGIVGTPVGLFQGFMWAYYQRMFRYLETGDKIALATQYATQAASFGLKTVPGFNEINNLWFQHSDGKNDPYDEIYKRFGQSTGDALMGGVWGNLPKLVGGKALDLSSRGDTAFNAPVLVDPTGTISRPPAIFSTAKKIATGVGQAIGLLGQNNPGLSGQEIAEIASNTIPNRPLAGMIESWGAGGNDTDNSGQLVARSHDWLDSAARVLGVRTQTQANEIEAFYANKQATEIRAGQRAELLRNTRGLLRGGDTDKLAGLFDNYVNTGGDPRHFKAWVKSTIQTASVTRGERQAGELMTNPANAQLIERIMGQQTGIKSEIQQVDPAVSMATADTMNNAQPTNSSTDDPELMYGALGDQQQ
jgi:DNA uptake protein ComE-like DNA-binding protein